MTNLQNEALSLVKRSILEELKLDHIGDYKPENNGLLDNKACYITLKIKKQGLRGCMGSLENDGMLYVDIISNAKKSAFGDSRFEPLKIEEIDELILEVTIISDLKPLKCDSMESLLKYLKINKPGIVLRLGQRQATYLPSLWDKFTDENEFIENLAIKAGIGFKELCDNFIDSEISEYHGEKISKKFTEIE